MSKTCFAFFFFSLFVFIITAPTIIVTIDKSIDISYFYSITEEEEESNDGKKNTELDVFVTENILDLKSLFFSIKDTDIRYAFKIYTTPNLCSTSPPPEFIL